jgi:hypothetical protein
MERYSWCKNLHRIETGPYSMYVYFRHTRLRVEISLQWYLCASRDILRRKFTSYCINRKQSLSMPSQATRRGSLLYWSVHSHVNSIQIYRTQTDKNFPFIYVQYNFNLSLRKQTEDVCRGLLVTLLNSPEATAKSSAGEISAYNINTIKLYRKTYA